jgi:hypothetical protein
LFQEPQRRTPRRFPQPQQHQMIEELSDLH